MCLYIKKTSSEMFLEELERCRFKINALRCWLLEHSVMAYDDKGGEAVISVCSRDKKMLSALSNCDSIIFDEVYLPFKDSINCP